jgi:putative transposase
MAEDRYAKNAAAVVSLKFYIVWCTKYRRPVLSDSGRGAAFLTEVADEHGIRIHVMEVMPDHV